MSGSGGLGETENEILDDARKAARDYAWGWFSYHAQQRQSVFRFYLVLMGAAVTGYVATISTDDSASGWSGYFGALIALFSFLFWQLDERSRRLVNVAQDYLKIDEATLANLVGESVRLAKRSDEQREGSWGLGWLSSFKIVYRIVFFVVGLVGLVLLANALQ